MNSCSVAFRRDVTVYILHEEIGSKYPVNEITPDVSIVKVVLEQGRYLYWMINEDTPFTT